VRDVRDVLSGRRSAAPFVFVVQCDEGDDRTFRIRKKVEEFKLGRKTGYRVRLEQVRLSGATEPEMEEPDEDDLLFDDDDEDGDDEDDDVFYDEDEED
jgi:hypothetical protein